MTSRDTETLHETDAGASADTRPTGVAGDAGVVTDPEDHALRDGDDGAPLASATEAPPEAIRSTAPPPESRRLWLAAIGSVLLILVAAGAVVVAQGGGRANAAWSWSPAPRPSDWHYFGWGDPALELAMPAGFEGTEMWAYPVDPSASPDDRAAQEQQNARLRSGAGRMAAMTRAAGISGNWVSVFVETGDASLSAFADRWMSQPSRGTVERTDVRLPSGPAVAVVNSGKTGAFTFVEVDYLIRLPDGRSLAIIVDRWAGGAEAIDKAAVQDFARRVAESLRVTP